MYCCANCFGDIFLDDLISVDAVSMGKCDYCDSNDIKLINPHELLNYFQSVCSIYTESSDTGAKLLISWLKEDWQIFISLSDHTAQVLLGEILDDGEIVRKNFKPPNDASSEASEKWMAFRNEIMWKNRFFFLHDLDLNRLETLFSTTYLDADISKFDLLYRARIQQDDLAVSIDKMGSPPVLETKNGRANPVGIPYLYVASTPETAIAETRPHPGDWLTVASFRTTSDLRLLNLQDPSKSISPFLVFDEDELPALRNDLAFLYLLEKELAKPILPRDADLEYLPTQYLCEFIKKCGFDGVIYKSSISDGLNIVLFDDSKVKAEVITQYEVTKLTYEQEQKEAL